MVTLMWSVVGKASGGFTKSYITPPVYLEADEIDPDNTGDSSITGRANYDGLTKGALKAAFPFAKSIFDNVAYGPHSHRLVGNKTDLEEVAE